MPFLLHHEILCTCWNIDQEERYFVVILKYRERIAVRHDKAFAEIFDPKGTRLGYDCLERKLTRGKKK